MFLMAFDGYTYYINITFVTLILCLIFTLYYFDHQKNPKNKVNKILVRVTNSIFYHTKSKTKICS